MVRVVGIPNTSWNLVGNGMGFSLEAMFYKVDNFLTHRAVGLLLKSVLQSLSGHLTLQALGSGSQSSGCQSPHQCSRFEPVFKGSTPWEPWTQRPWCLEPKLGAKEEPGERFEMELHRAVPTTPQTLCLWNKSLVLKKEKARQPLKDCHVPRVSHVIVGRPEVYSFLEELKCTPWDS